MAKFNYQHATDLEHPAMGLLILSELILILKFLNTFVFGQIYLKKSLY